MRDHRRHTKPVAEVQLQTWLLLGLIMLGSALLASLMLDRGHSWGDDFAQYILQAQSLLRGDMQEFVRRNAFTVDQSTATLGLTSYPWGFPLMLAPVYAVFGLDFFALKLVLTASYAAFLLAFFLLARTRLGDLESLLLTAFIAFNAHLLGAQNEIWADLPFLLWSTLSLWLVEQYVNRESPARPPLAAGIAVGLSIFMAVFTRFNGFLLFVPLAAAQLAHRRSAPSSPRSASDARMLAAAPYVTFAVCYALQAVLLSSVVGGLQHAFDSLSPLLLLHHAAYYFLLPGEFLQDSGLGGFVLYAPLLVFFIARLRYSFRKDAPLLLYMLATLAFYIPFPPLQGPRFIYPILPIFFLLAFDGMQAAVRKFLPHSPRAAAIVSYSFWIALIALSINASVADARKNLAADRRTPSGPLSPAASAMLDFVRTSTKADSVIIFYKPRAMRLFTDRDSFQTTSCDDLPKGDYVVIMAETEGGQAYNQIPPSSIEQCTSVTLTPRFEQPESRVYEISPHP